ncbi:MAG: ROK family protein [Verrucomicrobiota bacterium]
MTQPQCNSPYAVGIDFGGTSVKPALVQGDKIVRRGIPFDPQNRTAAETLLSMEAAVRELCMDLPSLVPVGIGLPGFVDSHTGIVYGLSNVVGWDEVPVSSILSDSLGVPVVLENDANAMAYGEWSFGAAANTRHAVCITLGTGVGGGLILNGELFRGAQMAAGELGHTSIDFNGPSGPYGNLGCLEMYVGNHAISSRGLAAYAAAGITPPTPLCTPRDLSDAARSGCPLASELWTSIGDELGAAFANIVWMLNPDVIVVGGGVAKAGELLFPHIERSLKSRTSSVINSQLRIVPAALGNDAGAIGCAALALSAAR